MQKFSLGKADLQRRLLEAFLKTSETDLADLERAIAANDFLAVEQRSHRIKGASANLGARSLLDVAAQLEQLGRSQSLVGANELSSELKSHLDRVRDFITTLLAE
ncbi:hypothetical protein OSCI_240001 [Kamptonema sp. PCC 6506]|nr:hypothetical protein OSCI_240001 [Kamptonema sp. PCC 6506]